SAMRATNGCSGARVWSVMAIEVRPHPCAPRSRPRVSLLYSASRERRRSPHSPPGSLRDGRETGRIGTRVGVWPGARRGGSEGVEGWERDGGAADGRIRHQRAVGAEGRGVEEGG